jgi:VanZ family protein
MKLLKTDKISIVWIIMVLAGIAWPGEDLPDISPMTNFDKVVHFILFGGVTLLLNISMTARGVGKRKAAIISLLAGAAYAALAEIIQIFVPGRECSLYDFYAGAIGAVLALVLLYIINLIKGKCS